MSVYRRTFVDRDPFPTSTGLVSGFDYEILEFLEQVDCPICPPTIAVNIRRSPTDTRVHCQTLHSLGLIEEKDTTRKAFQLNKTGEDFLAGNISIEALRPRR